MKSILSLNCSQQWSRGWNTTTAAPEQYQVMYQDQASEYFRIKRLFQLMHFGLHSVGCEAGWRG